MHTIGSTDSPTAGIPAFLAKLWRLVEDPDTNHLIYWSTDGNSFIIQNQAQFARELLPLNYKHNNMASFIRQLNMYGFHKITSIDNGGLKFDRDEIEFSHEYFQRGHLYLLEQIKRKIAHAKQPAEDQRSIVKPEALSRVLNDVKLMKGRQESLDSRFSAMRQENEALWREIAILRQKHMKQQRIVNQLIQFLVTLVQPSGPMGAGVKRRYPLMLSDVPSTSKSRKRSNSSGPVIHELNEDIDTDGVFGALEDNDNKLPNSKCNSPVAGSPDVVLPSNKPSVEYSNIEDDVDQEFDDNAVVEALEEFNNANELAQEQMEENLPEYAEPVEPQRKYSSRQAAKKAKDNIKAYTNVIAGGRQSCGGKSIPTAEKGNDAEQSLSPSAPAKPKPYTWNPIKQPEVGQYSDVPLDIFETETTNDAELRGSYNPTLSEDYTKKIQEPGTSNDLALAKFNKFGSYEDILKLNSPEDIHYHLENTQGDLDNLKEFLRNNDNYQSDLNIPVSSNAGPYKLTSSFDGDFLSKLFNDTDVLPSFGVPVSQDSKQNDNTTGSELTAYQPDNNLDLSDLLGMSENINALAYENNPEDPKEMSPPKKLSMRTATASNNSSELNTPSSSELNTPLIEKESYFSQ